MSIAHRTQPPEPVQTGERLTIAHLHARAAQGALDEHLRSLALMRFDAIAPGLSGEAAVTMTCAGTVTYLRPNCRRRVHAMICAPRLTFKGLAACASS